MIPKTDQFISLDPQKSFKYQKVEKIQSLMSEGKTIKQISEIVGADPGNASVLSRVSLDSLDTPPPRDGWEYRPLWIESDKYGHSKWYIREDGLVWDALKGEFRRCDRDVDGYVIYNHSGRAFKAHRLVLWAFHGEPPEDKKFSRHLDGVSSNNFYTNLAWGSLDENAVDKIIQGRQRFRSGERNPWYKNGSQSKLKGRTFTRITRKMVFDAGHRVPFHESKCSNLHGHTWTIEATFFGEVNPVRGSSNDGMLIDFGIAKKIMSEEVVDKWDHGFLVWRGDKKVLKALECLENHKTVIVDGPPTSEYLAQKAFIDINRRVVNEYGFSLSIILERVRLYETPNCWADYKSLAIDGIKFNV